MFFESKIKDEAKFKLKNNWPSAIFITLFKITLLCLFILIYLSISYSLGINILEIAFSSSFHPYYILKTLRLFPTINLFLFVALSLFFIIGFVLFWIPFALGIKRWYYKLSLGQKESLSQVFYYFKKHKLFLRSIFYFTQLAFKLILFSFLFITPGLVLLIISSIFMQNQDFNVHNLCAFGIVLSFLFIFIGIVLFFIVYMRYFLSSYILVSNDNITLKACFNLSFKASKGNVFKIIIFVFKFIPWLILIFLAIPIVYVVPYFKTSLSVYIKWLIKKYND